MNLQTLRKSISQMDFPEALSIIMDMRNSRHTRKIPHKKPQKAAKAAKATTTQKTDNLIKNLTTAQKRVLLEAFLES